MGYFIEQGTLILVVSWLAWIVAASPDFFITHAREGDNKTVTCNTTTDPDVSVYWTHGDSPDVFQTGSRLELINVSRGDAGNYTCHRANSREPGQSQAVCVVDIEVCYPAEITEFSVTPTTASENDTFVITCHVAGNPSPAWEIRHNVTHDVLYRSSEAGGATVNVTAECTHNGAFVCTGNNSLNSEVNATRKQDVKVLSAPRMTLSVPNSQVNTGYIGFTAIFAGVVCGFQAPTFSWSRADGGQIENRNVTDHFRGYQSISVLTMTNIQISDYGNLSFSVNNSYGRYISTFVLKPAPFQTLEAPTNLTFCDVKYHSVRLNWTSGFDMWGNMSFVVMRLHDTFGSWTEKLATFTPTESYADHGVGQEWSHEFTGLEHGIYHVAMVAKTPELGTTSGYSNTVSFVIKSNTTVTDDGSYPALPEVDHTLLTLAYVGGAMLGSFLVAALIFAILARRKEQSSSIFSSNVALSGIKSNANS